MRTVALEALVINRYLVAELPFYKRIEAIISSCMSVNYQVFRWPESRDRIEEWMNRQCPLIADRFKNCRVEVQSHMKSLSSVL